MIPRTDHTINRTENHMRTTRSPLLVLLAALLAALALTACSGGDGDEDGSEVATLQDGTRDKGEGDTTSTTLDFQAQLLRYARCMRGEGIDYPDPGPDGEMRRVEVEPGQEAALRAAEKACEDVRPRGRELTDDEEAEMYEAFLALAKCLREAGFDVPDPVIGPDGLKFLIPGGGSGSNPELDAAVQSCRAEGGGDDGPSGLAGG